MTWGDGRRHGRATPESITASDAAARLQELLAEVAAGRSVVIARGDASVALTPLA